MADQVNLPSDEDLVRRVLRNIRPHDRGSCVRWAAVVDVFALGSTYAMHLCRRFNLDPHEKICLWMDECPVCGNTKQPHFCDEDDLAADHDGHDHAD